jgi:hypothetical protein
MSRKSQLGCNYQAPTQTQTSNTSITYRHNNLQIGTD